MKSLVIASALLAFATPALAQTSFTSAPNHPPSGWNGHGPDGGPEGREGPGGRRGPGGPDRMFAMMDANHDGVVSRAEFDQFHARMREMRQERRGEGEGHGWGRGPGGPGGQGPDGDGPPPPRGK